MCCVLWCLESGSVVYKGFSDRVYMGECRASLLESGIRWMRIF